MLQYRAIKSAVLCKFRTVKDRPKAGRTWEDERCYKAPCYPPETTIMCQIWWIYLSFSFSTTLPVTLILSRANQNLGTFNDLSSSKVLPLPFVWTVSQLNLANRFWPLGAAPEESLAKYFKLFVGFFPIKCIPEGTYKSINITQTKLQNSDNLS